MESVTGRHLVRAGVTACKAHLWLVLLLYAVNAALSVTVSLLLVDPLQEAVAGSGFGEELVQGPDLALWADILISATPDLLSQAWHLLWILPLSFLWKAAASVGMLHCFRAPELGFWRGAAHYVLPSTLLGILFLILAMAGAGLAALLVAAAGSGWSGEVGRFWINIIAAPTFAALVVTLATVMRDVARATLVVADRPFWEAVRYGILAPLRHRSIACPFLVCMAVGSVLAGLAVVADIRVTAGSSTLLFVGGQFIQLGIAAVIVGWYGSLAAYAEAVCARPDSSAEPVA